VISFSRVSMGDGSVCRCVRCAPTPGRPAQLDEIAASLTGALQDAASSDVPAGVRLGGYEPFAHPELVRVVSTASQAGITRLMLATDGGALSSINNARGSIEAGVRLFEVVFHGPDAGLHDRLSGSDGSFDRALAGLRNVRDAARDLGVRVAPLALLRVCRHSNPLFLTTVASIANSGLVRAMRVAVDPAVTLSPDTVSAAVHEATAAGVAIFGDGFESHLGGAAPYWLDSRIPDAMPGRLR